MEEDDALEKVIEKYKEKDSSKGKTTVSLG